MANKLNFTGWSGTFDLSKLNISGRTQSSPQENSKIITGPVVIDSNRPKKSTLTPGVQQPLVTRVKTEPNPDFTKATKLSRQSRLSLNFSLESNGLPFTAGTIDTSFPYSANTGFNEEVNVVKVQSDGKILVGGLFSSYTYDEQTYFAPYLIRLNSDGSPDFDFYYTDKAESEGWNLDGWVGTIDIQSDGKIVIGGNFEYYYEDITRYSPGIMRFNSDGTFDDTLFVGEGFNDAVSTIIVQPDGKILVAGSFLEYNTASATRIIRLNSNGNPDLSFGTGNGVNGTVSDMVLQPNGKIILGGDFSQYDGDDSNNIVRINSNGGIDNTFVVGDGFNDMVRTLALQSDGKVIVGGAFNYYNNIDLYNGYIVRLGANGDMDTRFGYGFDNDIYSLSIQSDDKILIGGEMGVFNIDNDNFLNINALVRFHSDCTFDFSFDYDESINGIVYSIELDSDDKIYIGGYFQEGGAPYLLNYFGRINNSILEYPYTYTVEACVQPLIDETITYVVGSMTPLTGNETYSFQRIQNPSITVCGNIVPTYPSNIIEYVAINSYVDCEEAYTSNYKIVVFEDCLGDFSSTPFWVVDNRFEIGDIFYVDSVIQQMGILFLKFAATIIDVIPWSGGTGPFGDVWDYIQPINYVTYLSCDDAIEANGLIYEANSCISSGTTYPLIHTAYYDYTTILIPTENSPVNVISNYLPIGPYEFISGGTPEIYSTIKIADNGDCELGLSKISPNGILNENFNDGGFGSGNTFVYTTVEQPDGKLLVGGNFEEYDGLPMNNFMRLSSNGNIDGTFVIGDGFDDIVWALVLQSDGKILVGGDFNEYNGVVTGNLARLNSDGSLDDTFLLNGFNYTVRAIAVQIDGKIVVGGEFTPQILRINSDGTPDTTFNPSNFNGNVHTINIETIRNTPFYVTNSPATYTENIIVGGQFSSYSGTNVGGIVKLSPIGNILPDFGNGFNQDTGGTPRVNKIVQQPDGKLIVIGGSDGHDLRDYNETWIPQNIVRLVKVNNRYVIDQTFTTQNWDDSPIGGLGGSAFALTVLPNDKIMVGGLFTYYGDNNTGHTTSSLIRLNSDGTLDTTFTFEISAVTYTTQLLSSGALLVGGGFTSPTDRLLELFIGEEYVLRSFTTCDGKTSNIFVSKNYEPINEIKANVSDRVAVCGTVGNVITTPNLNVGTGFTLFTATNTTSYNTCDECGQIYKSIFYVRDGGVNIDSIKQFLLTPNSISDINTKGPIFTLKGTECYELLKYYY
jgi:uncharacterized delta-60 repeat protein